MEQGGEIVKDLTKYSMHYKTLQIFMFLASFY